MNRTIARTRARTVQAEEHVAGREMFDAPPPAHVTANVSRRNSRSGAVILLCCLLLAVSVVLVAPLLLTGGAAAVPLASSEPPVRYYSSSVPYPSVEAAAAALGFTPATPSLPEGYAAGHIAVLDGAVFEQAFSNGKTEIIYRTAAGSDDLSFIDKTYQYSATQETNGVSRTYEGGSDKKLNLCVWGNGGYSYAFVADDGVPAGELHQLAESIL